MENNASAAFLDAVRWSMPATRKAVGAAVDPERLRYEGYPLDTIALDGMAKGSVRKDCAHSNRKCASLRHKAPERSAVPRISRFQVLRIVEARYGRNAGVFILR